MWCLASGLSPASPAGKWVSGHKKGWTMLPLQGSVGAVTQPFTTLSFWEVYERRSAWRLAFLLAVYNFQFLKSFTDKIHLAELGNMTTWMMPANHSQKSFSNSLTWEQNNANIFQIISSNSLQALCIENLFCVWGQRFVTQNNWWIEIQIHSAWCTSLLFAATGSGWIILQMMYCPCFTFPINPPCLHPLGLRVLMATTCRSEISPAESLLLLAGSKNLHSNLQATVSFQ